MKLAQYLIAKRVTSRAFAKRVRSSLGAVSKWRQGERIPRMGFMTRIHHATKGRVTYKDWQ